MNNNNNNLINTSFVVEMWEQLFQTVFLLNFIDIFVITSSYSVEAPEFKDQINNVTVASGRDTVLECTVNNLGTYKVAWLKVEAIDLDSSESTLLTIHTQTVIKDSRFRVSHNNYRQWYLHIKTVRPNDKGWYMCQINSEPMINQAGFLDVLIPPSIVDYETSSDTSVDERQKLSLRCRANGYPPPTITWRREDTKELNLGLYGGKKYTAAKVEGEYLNITQVTREDMGAYLCIASNSVPPSVSKRIIVRVNFRPKIKVSNQLVGSSLGSDVQLECRCEASPLPVTSWIRSDGVILLPTHKYQTREEHDSYRTKMKLKITNLEAKDFGTYKCVAKNSLGEKEGLVRLYEVAIPTTPVYPFAAWPTSFLSPNQRNSSVTKSNVGSSMMGDTKDDTSVSSSAKSDSSKSGAFNNCLINYYLIAITVLIVFKINSNDLIKI